MVMRKISPTNAARTQMTITKTFQADFNRFHWGLSSMAPKFLLRFFYTVSSLKDQQQGHLGRLRSGRCYAQQSIIPNGNCFNFSLACLLHLKPGSTAKLGGPGRCALNLK